MKRLYFTKDNIWVGGFYELAIEVGPRSDEQISAVVNTIWSHPTLEGCYLDRNKEPYDQQKITPSQFALASGLHLLGLAQLPNGHRIACGTCNVRELDGPDWVDFYMPMGSLGEAYYVGGYPFDREVNSSDHWQKPIDDWLMEMASYVFSTARYKLGIIGLEVSGQEYSSRLEETGIPEERYYSFLWPSGEEIKYYPRNK